MKHLFIINPVAGKTDRTGELTQNIRALAGAQGLDYEILVSRAAGDCTKIAQAAAAAGGELRIYACGGDGTLNEVVNGAVGFANAAVTHFPCGTGNDFIKIFSEPTAFFYLNRLLDAQETKFDLIVCQKKFYSINICSMGLDARIGTEVGKYKRLPLVGGKSAYLLSTAANLIKGLHEHYVVEIDGEVFDGRQTMICITNGRWYGGGFNPTPNAEPDDGILEVLLVNKVSRFAVAGVIGKYKNGEFEKLPKLVRHFRARHVAIHCDKESEINIDGELIMAKDAEFAVVPQAIRFFYPQGVHYAHE
ncbi:MAG: diacylglycerol kinase family lipid kinase [Oscillospiraceae bacterium]|jgi:YegS/Rv2252/BmrU family lipid kinase|nr:diacylglycerol kinase family lipid kinase [Oscillospiraceae bacterium]